MKEKKRNIKVTVEYDGTEYCGFQKQKSDNSIQAELEKALSRVCNEKIRVIGSGRTDSGVHAKAHAVNFVTTSRLPLNNVLKGANTFLPDDIAVTSIRTVPEKFHARFSAKRKVYVYSVWNSQRRSPLSRRFRYQYVFPLDVLRMKKAAKLFCGTHDFRSFAAKCRTKEHTVRTIYSLTITRRGALIRFRVEGDGFLYNMVRTIVGTLLLVGRGKLSISDVKTILSCKDRTTAGPTVPAHGLTLLNVIY